jgi:hypothetical protein
LTIARTAFAALLLIEPGFSQSTAAPSELLLRPWGGPALFPPIYRQSIDAFFNAEDAYRHADYKRASQILDAFWTVHPPGTLEWSRGASDAAALAQSRGVNFGTPGCYYALRMLTECVSWRLRTGGSARSHAIRMTIVLVGHSSGIQPESTQELRQGTGHRVHHSLDSALASGDSGIIDQSLFLFKEYIRAITGGRLQVEVKILPLADLEVHVQAFEQVLSIAGADRNLLFAQLAPDAMQNIWKSVPGDVQSATDWWWVLYPSHVPEPRGEFAHGNFITGGMGLGPDGRSPAFIIDDLWLVRIPPPLGKGPYTEEQRRTYLPQWFQHEFFHHLYRTYSELHLEVSSHSWFDRSTWPPDFDGLLETDYYAESLHKRLQSATPPLHAALRYAPPSKSLFRKITPAMLRGKYRCGPPESNCGQGVIDWNAPPGTDPKKMLRWTNETGVSLRLTPDLKNGLLYTGDIEEAANGREFRIVLRRDANGEYLPEVYGIQVLGVVYRKIQMPRQADFQSAAGCQPALPGGLRAEFVLMDLDRGPVLIRAHHAAAGHQF